MEKITNSEMSYDLLNKELDRAYSSLNNHYNILTQMLVVATTLIGGLIAYIYSNTSSNSPILNLLIFIGPLAVLGLFGAAIVLLYQMGFFIYLIRDISNQIKTQFKAEFTLYYDTDSFASKSQSFLRGDSVFNFARAGTLFIPIVLFLGLVWLSFQILYEYNHLFGVMFGVLYGFGMIYLIIGLTGALVTLPQKYKIYQVEKISDINSVITELHKSTKSSILRVFLPRPIDFLSKGFFVFVGVGMAAFENKIVCIASTNLDCFTEVKQFIFSPPYPNKLYTLVLYVIFWFVIQEFFVQQAKYLWNDIRDRNSDNFIPANKLRPITNSKISFFTYMELVVRWTLGLILAYFLSIKLFWVVILLSTLQGIYEFYGKPNSAKYPYIPLFVIAAGTSLRFLSGAYSVGWELGDGNLWAYSLIMFCLGTTTSAIMWKVEAEYVLKQGQKPPRKQSGHFLQKGHIWLIASWFSCGVTLGLLTSNIFLGNLLLIFAYLNKYSLIWAYICNISIGIVLLGISYVLVSPIFHVVSKTQNRAVKKIMAYLFAFAGITIIAWLFANLWQSNLVIVIFGTLVCLSFVQYWSIGYEEFSLMNLGKNIILILKVFGYWFFVAESGIKLRYIIWMIMNFNSSTLEKSVSEMQNKIGYT